MLNKHSYIQVIGTPVLEHKSYVTLAKKGLILTRSGVRKSAGLSRRKDYIYGIRYVNTQTKEKIYFEPHANFSAKVRKSIEETNTYFHAS